MSEKVTVESLYAKQTFTSTGGMKTAIKKFLSTHPDDIFGNVIIRSVSRQWYIKGGAIKIV